MRVQGRRAMTHMRVQGRRAMTHMRVQGRRVSSINKLVIHERPCCLVLPATALPYLPAAALPLLPC